MVERRWIASAVMRLCGMLALMLLVTACAATGRAGNCAGWTMIEGEPEDADVISDRLAVSIASHNRHYAETCR